jgi:hypothetical protein
MWIHLMLTNDKELYHVICTELHLETILSEVAELWGARELERTTSDSCWLDGGGVIATSIPPIKLVIKDHQFELKPEHVLKLHILLQNPHQTQNRTWVRVWNAAVVMPTEVYNELQAILTSPQLVDAYTQINSEIQQVIKGPAVVATQFNNQIGEA